MADNTRTVATCPLFLARVDYRGISEIQCRHNRYLYFDRAERDADYLAACCCEPMDCPLCRVPLEQRTTAARQARNAGKFTKPAYWPITSKYPTIEDLKQEARNHGKY